MTTTTETISIQALASDYPGQIHDGVTAGSWVVITVWEDQYGECTDLLTGSGATEAEAMADVTRSRRKGEIDGGEDCTYLVTTTEITLESTLATVREAVAAGQTVAQAVGAQFCDDGQVFVVPGSDDDGDGVSLGDVCREIGTSVSDGFDKERFDFADGSNIVIAGAAWDFGFSGATCFCWPEANWGQHADECPERRDA